MGLSGFFDKKIIFLIVAFLGLDLILMNLGPTNSLDIRFYYTFDQAKSFIENMNPHERHSYFINELFDLCLIVTYSTASFLSVYRLFPNQKGILFFSVLGGFCDLIETISIILVLKFDRSYDVFNWLGFFTAIKWVAGGVYLLIILFGLVKLATRKRTL